MFSLKAQWCSAIREHLCHLSMSFHHPSIYENVCPCLVKNDWQPMKSNLTHREENLTYSHTHSKPWLKVLTFRQGNTHTHLNSHKEPCSFQEVITLWEFFNYSADGQRAICAFLLKELKKRLRLINPFPFQSSINGTSAWDRCLDMQYTDCSINFFSISDVRHAATAM